MPIVPVVVGICALVLSVLVAASLGRAAVPFDVQLHIIGHRFFGIGKVTWPSAYEDVLFTVRWPRIAAAALVGCALSTAGAGYQGLFRNPLADPYLLGVASGAGLGAVIAFVIPMPALLYGTGIVQLLAFVGALITTAIVYSLARVGRSTSVTMLILAGVAIGALENALMAFLMETHGDQLQAIYGWLLGGFNAVEWSQVTLVAPIIGVCITAILLCARMLNVLQLDEDQAMSLGVSVEKAKILVVIACTLATAGAVSMSGLIGFVGLIVPHAVRMIFGSDFRRLLPASMLLGAAYLVCADALARSLPTAGEVPVGIITALCGAPFFLVLLRRRGLGVY